MSTCPRLLHSTFAPALCLTIALLFTGCGKGNDTIPTASISTAEPPIPTIPGQPEPAVEPPVPQSKSDPAPPAVTTPSEPKPGPLLPTILKFGVNEGSYMAALTPDGWVGDRVWSAMSGFKDGLCPVQEKKNGNWGVIDLKGNLVVPLEYSGTWQPMEGLIRVRKKKAFGYLHLDGSIAVPINPEWENVGDFACDRAPVKQGELWGYIDKSGKFVIPPTFAIAMLFHSDTKIARIQRNHLWGFIDPAGKEVIPCQFEEVLAFDESGKVAWFKRADLWGLIDKTGKEIVPPTWDQANEFKDGLAGVRNLGTALWGFVNLKGEVVIPNRFQKIAAFSEGYCDVCLDSKWILIDAKGQENTSIAADEVWNPARGLAKIKTKDDFGRYRLANLRQNRIEPGRWDDIWHAPETHTVVREPSNFNRNLYAVRDADGNFSVSYPEPAIEPPAQAPLLRIDADMHTASITGLAIDRAGTLVLTSSSDGTGKLWKLENGATRLIRTFRPSSGDPIEGCALSPDGKIAVLNVDGCILFNTDTGKLINGMSLGGRRATFSPSGTMFATGGTLFSTSSGRPIVNLAREGYNEAIWPVENMLWTCGNEFIRRYDLNKFQGGDTSAQLIEIKPSKVLNSAEPLRSSGFSISPDRAQLAVLHENSRDVFIHDAMDLHLIKKLEATVGSTEPMLASTWLTDGRLACAGQWSKPNQNSMTWPIRIWPALALRTGSKIKAQPVDLPSANNSIFDLQTLPIAGLAFSAFTPEWGILETSPGNVTKAKILGASPIAAFNGDTFRDEGNFRISQDASIIAFEYGIGRSAALFSVFDQKLTVLKKGDSLPDTLQKPRRESLSLAVELKNESFTINGAPVEEAPKTLTYAISEDDSRLLLATRSGCQLYNAKGKRLWSVNEARHCWAVNLSRNGKMALAAYDDGTIRWHDLENEGREFLVLFPHADQARWVLWATAYDHEKTWTSDPRLPGNYGSSGGKPIMKILATNPEMDRSGIKVDDTLLEVNGQKIDGVSAIRKVLEEVSNEQALEITYEQGGVSKKTTVHAVRDFKLGELKQTGTYFTCSAGAESLIGWHINRGPNREADFYPAAQLYANFYRPDIVLEVLKQKRGAGEIARELGVAFNLESALKKLPVLKLQGVADGETMGTDVIGVTLEVWDTGGGVKDISLFHNGKRIPQDGPGSRRGEIRTLSYTITLQPGENELKGQAANDADTISNPAIAKVKFNGAQATSTLHLLTIGLNRYLNPKYNLTYCVPDADACQEAFTQRAPGLFAEVKTHALRDDQATKPNVAAKFAELAKSAKPQDVFILCYAGHGVMTEKPGSASHESEFYLVPHDVTRMYGDPEMMAQKAVSKADLETWCAAIPARKQVMLLDTCQSGGLVDTYAMRGVAEEKAIAMLARSTGTMVIASTGAEAYARESKDIGHGIFTKALLDGLLDGKADADKDGKITVKEVDTYLGSAVPELSQKLTNTAQFPTSYARGQDFPVGLVK